MRRLIFGAIFIVVLNCLPASALAHPLGQEWFGQRANLYIHPDHIEYRYVIEIPTTVLLSKIMEYKLDRGITRFDQQASDQFNRHMLGQLKKGLKLYIDGKRHGWQPDPKFTDSAGEGEVNFFEYRLRLVTHIPDTREGTRSKLEIVNENFEDQRSVYLNGLVAERGVRIEDSNVPREMEWSYDYSYRRMKVDVELDPTWKRETRLGSEARPKQGLVQRFRDRMNTFLRAERPSLSVILIALGAAFILGAAHALSPGHGKTLVSAYLVGARGSYIHAILLGLIVTFTHTASIFILGLVFLLFSAKWLTEQFTPYIGATSGTIIVMIGVYMFYKRLVELKAHGHEHIHGEPTVGIKSLLAMGISGGMVPCPSGLALMLMAISINRVAWGMALVGAFSIGLAVVLVFLGVLAIGAMGVFRRLKIKAGVWGYIPLVSSVVVMVVGIMLVLASLQAL